VAPERNERHAGLHAQKGVACRVGARTEDAVHFGKVDDDAAVGNCAGGDAGARALDGDGLRLFGGGAYGRDQLVGITWKSDGLSGTTFARFVAQKIDRYVILKHSDSKNVKIIQSKAEVNAKLVMLGGR